MNSGIFAVVDAAILLVIRSKMRVHHVTKLPRQFALHDSAETSIVGDLAIEYKIICSVFGVDDFRLKIGKTRLEVTTKPGNSLSNNALGSETSARPSA